MTTIRWSDRLTFLPSTERRKSAICGPADLFLNDKGKLRKNLYVQMGANRVPITFAGKPFQRGAERMVYVYMHTPARQVGLDGMYRTRGLI